MIRCSIDNKMSFIFLDKETVMLLQAALAAMIVSTGVVVLEMRRIDDRYISQQDRINARLNLNADQNDRINQRLNRTADQLDELQNVNRDLKVINQLLNEDVNNLHSTVQNHNKAIENYKDKGKEKE